MGARQSIGSWTSVWSSWTQDGELEHVSPRTYRHKAPIEVMTHADLNTLKIGDTITQCLVSDLKVELGGRDTLIYGVT